MVDDDGTFNTIHYGKRRDQARLIRNRVRSLCRSTGARGPRGRLALHPDDDRHGLWERRRRSAS